MGGDETPPLAPDPIRSTARVTAHTWPTSPGGTTGWPRGRPLRPQGVRNPIHRLLGVALLQAMDWVLDPDGNGDTRDRVDIVNMSLGAFTGRLRRRPVAGGGERIPHGILTVAAGGNGGDKPYVLDTPGATPSALSVAQTNMPSAVLPLLQVLTPEDIAGEYTAVFQPWSVAPTG